MKKLIYASLVMAAIAVSAQAQTGARFGYKLGYSMATQYGIKPADDAYIVDTRWRSGFAGGLFVYFPITESVGIQQELLYTMKGSRQDVTATNPVPVNTVSKYDMSYFEMPILLRYRFVKIKNIGIYGNTGIALSLLLDGNYSVKSTIQTGGPVVVIEESGNMDGLDTFDYSFVYGAGLDFNLFKKDFFLEYRFTVGWNTLEMPTLAGQPTVPLRNQDYIFALGMFF